MKFDFWFANCCHAELVIQGLETLQDINELQAFSIECVTSELFQLEWYHVWPNELHNQCFDDMTILGDFARYKWNWCHVIYSGGYPGVTLSTLEAILKLKLSWKLQSCFKGLAMKSSGLLSFDVSCSVMGRLENLEIQYVIVTS